MAEIRVRIDMIGGYQEYHTIYVNVLLLTSQILVHVRIVYTSIYIRECMCNIFLYFPMFLAI